MYIAGAHTFFLNSANKSTYDLAHLVLKSIFGRRSLMFDGDKFDGRISRFCGCQVICYILTYSSFLSTVCKGMLAPFAGSLIPPCISGHGSTSTNSPNRCIGRFTPLVFFLR